MGKNRHLVALTRADCSAYLLSDGKSCVHRWENCSNHPLHINSPNSAVVQVVKGDRLFAKSLLHLVFLKRNHPVRESVAWTTVWSYSTSVANGYCIPLFSFNDLENMIFSDRLITLYSWISFSVSCWSLNSVNSHNWWLAVKMNWLDTSDEFDVRNPQQGSSLANKALLSSFYLWWM